MQRSLPPGTARASATNDFAPARGPRAHPGAPTHLLPALRRSSTHLLPALRRPAVETAGWKQRQAGPEAGSLWALHGSTAPRACCGVSHKLVALASWPADQRRRVPVPASSKEPASGPAWRSFKPAVSTAGRRSAGNRCAEEQRLWGRSPNRRATPVTTGISSPQWKPAHAGLALLLPRR